MSHVIAAVDTPISVAIF